MSLRYRHRPRIPAEIRFWRRVEMRGECLVWTGACDRDGYGVFNLPRDDTPSGERVWIYAHRFVWTLAHGPIPDGMQVLHDCDNPPCITDGHLFLGTNLDNVADRVRKLRGGTKLTEAKARAILIDCRSTKAIASAYGISDSLIYMLRSGRVWRHLNTGISA
jgi:HNH endonuclease